MIDAREFLDISQGEKPKPLFRYGIYKGNGKVQFDNENFIRRKTYKVLKPAAITQTGIIEIPEGKRVMLVRDRNTYVIIGYIE